MRVFLIIVTLFAGLAGVARGDDSLEALDATELAPEFQAALAEIAEGRALALQEDYAAALALLEPAAEAGNVAALNLVGVLRTDRDPEAAAFYDVRAGLAALEASASAGFPPAMHNLGLFFGETHGEVAPDAPLAAQWFEAAYAAPYGSSAYELARVLANETGVEADYPRARALAAEAAARDTSGDAQALLGDLAYYETDRAPDYPRALAHYEESAAMGNGYGAYNAGLMYHYGDGVEADTARALPFFEQAYGVDQDGAGWELFFIYAYDADLSDADRAREIAVAADAAGEANGAYMLGDLAYFGVGQPASFAAALAFFYTAVERDPVHRQALFSVGYMLMRGEGAEVDLATAATFLDRADAAGSENALYEIAALHGSADYAGPHQDPARAEAACTRLGELGIALDPEAHGLAYEVCAA